VWLGHEPVCIPSRVQLLELIRHLLLSQIFTEHLPGQGFPLERFVIRPLSLDTVLSQVGQVGKLLEGGVLLFAHCSKQASLPRFIKRGQLKRPLAYGALIRLPPLGVELRSLMLWSLAAVDRLRLVEGPSEGLLHAPGSLALARLAPSLVHISCESLVSIGFEVYFLGLQLAHFVLQVDDLLITLRQFVHELSALL